MRDAVLLNSAAALVAYDGVASDAELAPALEAAMGRAAAAIDSGDAAGLLERWARFTSAAA